MRMTAGNFRVKSHQGGDLGPHANSIELSEFLRRPNFKKDHFVFSMADKTDTPDSTISFSQPGLKSYAISFGRSTTQTASSRYPLPTPAAPTKPTSAKATTASW